MGRYSAETKDVKGEEVGNHRLSRMFMLPAQPQSTSNATRMTIKYIWDLCAADIRNRV